MRRHFQDEDEAWRETKLIFVMTLIFFAIVGVGIGGWAAGWW
jgi:hypothetical protein